MTKLSPLSLAAGGGALVVGLFLILSHGGAPAVTEPGAVPIPDRPDWNWDVRPILSQNCFACHGQATQKAGLRLDDREVATGELPENKGHRAIVPGNPGKSELIKRVSSQDIDFRMPPKETHKSLSARDIAILERWIDQGASYKKHWAYITPTLVHPARTQWDSQAINEIDRYIYAKLAENGLSPSKPADRETLINRVTLDLTGLPPTLEEVDAFVADDDPKAYERLVDRLLASTEYAERQTNIWLDAARYADTRGGLNDGQRPLSYPYRDWLISAFKQNLPYDQFVIWQLAGDKLNGGKPTREQLLATAFLKAGRQDSEGGSIDEEFRTNYVQERTELIGKDFLGLTLGCAKCHDHKYDVISQADYYAIAAFFNQMDERGGGGFNRGTPQGPYLLWPSPKQSEQLHEAHAATLARQAEYDEALRAARAKAEAAVAAAPLDRLAEQVKASIDEDTQAYYPFDDAYVGDLTPLMVDAQKQGPGVYPQDPNSPLQKALRKMTRPEAIEFLQAKIAADVAAGKPVPNLSGASKSGRRRAGMLADLEAMKADPGLPRLASQEVEWALEQLIAAGYTDELLSDGGIIKKRGLRTWLKEGRVLWTRSGIPGREPGFVSNVTFVDGARGKGVQMHDSVVATAKGVGMFERTQPYSLDFWVRLRPEPAYVDSTRPEGPAANVLYSSGSVNGQGYEIGLLEGRLTYAITHNAPYEQLKISLRDPVPAGRWVHVTTTYDGHSSAKGMRFYIDGKLAPVTIEHDHLTLSALPQGPADSLFFAYYGLSSGTNFNRTELVDGALDELRVITRALTPMEVAYLHNPALLASVTESDARRQLAEIRAAKDPTVVDAKARLSAAQIAEQKIRAAIRKVMVAGDQPLYRKSFVLDRGVYNAYRQEVKPQGLPRVFAWNEKLPRDRLGLAQWLMDPKNPLTARVYVNRMWQSHFGTGIVQTVEDFGTQGTNPSHPELLDYLAIEFIKSGWDIKHMHKLMVMSATYRQDSNITPENLEKDPRNTLLERGPRFRMPAEVIRDNALMASGLLLKQVGGDSVFPYAPPAIWYGVATGLTVYPTNVPDDQMHRRSMYTYVKRNAPVANLDVFDMPNRNDASVSRPISNTPLQGLVLLNDTQFVEAYRKLAERVLRASADEDQQLTTLWRLAVRRSPRATELAATRKLLHSELERMKAKPEKAQKLLSIGVSPVDPEADPLELAAMTVVTAGVMNTPDAYTLR
ncbi:MAG TPA: DUF1553 domain-containing protein [Steroidobacteraceae bacterium]|nr:DUF1553 domain-containing protein [Steroidobacteraceae bacterium]